MGKFLEEVKKIIADMLEIIGVEGEIEIREEETGRIINILTPEASFLIGQGGMNLHALQHLVRLLAGKKIEKTGEEAIGEEGKERNFALDVNNYRHNRVEMIRDLALDKAGQASNEKRNVALHPMTAYERRVVHMALQGRKDVICESEGDGPERHIVIKPA